MLRFCVVISIALVMPLLVSVSHSFSDLPTASKNPAMSKNGAYILSYFKYGGKDGLHIAYSYDGLKWMHWDKRSKQLKSNIAPENRIRDPSISLDSAGVFHLVWTTGGMDKGIGYSKSNDLLSWSSPVVLPVMESIKGAINVWAPEIFYEQEKNLFILTWASTVPGVFPHTDGQSGKGERPGWNHRIYYSLTKDFKDFSSPKILFDGGFNAIDPFILNFSGKYYLFLKDETDKPFAPQKRIKIAASDKVTGPYKLVQQPAEIKPPVEGASAMERGGKIYLYYDRYRENRYGLSVTTDMKVWREMSDKLEFPSGARHGTVLFVPPEKWNSLVME